MSDYSPDWLSLREPADAAARSAALLDPLRRRLPEQPLVIHDLGCGTGAMARWLAPRLPGPQHWVLYDRDPALLAHAAATVVDPGDGGAVTRQTRDRDITALADDDLAGASLVTASALLDLLTRDEVRRLAARCVRAGCPALLTLTVVGQVDLTPADPLDPVITAAFNAHQRRRTGDRHLLGPDAAEATADAFAELGATTRQRPSPWRLGAGQAALTGRWLHGWVDAACAQQPDLAGPATAYLARRLDAAAAGELRVVIGHTDLLAHHD